jgi:pilus assembly protein CpaB
MRNKFLVLLSLLMALAAAAFIYYYLEGLKKTYQQQDDFQAVLVATTEIPAKTQVTAKMVAVREMPARYISPNSCRDPEEVLGKTTRSQILPGEIVRLEKLASGKDAGEGLAFLVKPGMRAITVAVNDVSGLAGLLRPGDRVDVLGTFEAPAAAGQEKTTLTSLLVQNLEVLALSQTLEANQTSGDGHTQYNYRNVTLMVAPEQAQPLTLCSEKGSIRMMLRAPVDQGTIYLPPLNLTQLAR